jgi:hypothetical protein
MDTYGSYVSTVLTVNVAAGTSSASGGDRLIGAGSASCWWQTYHKPVSAIYLSIYLSIYVIPQGGGQKSQSSLAPPGPSCPSSAPVECLQMARKIREGATWGAVGGWQLTGSQIFLSRRPFGLCRAFSWELFSSATGRKGQSGQ